MPCPEAGAAAMNGARSASRSGWPVWSQRAEQQEATKNLADREVDDLGGAEADFPTPRRRTDHALIAAHLIVVSSVLRHDRLARSRPLRLFCRQHVLRSLSVPGQRISSRLGPLTSEFARSTSSIARWMRRGRGSCQLGSYHGPRTWKKRDTAEGC
ncbi:hypothetical protein VTN02DRAFT_6514 [Thermoascus thermophilus]